MAILRIEQLYPLPEEFLRELLANYADGTPVYGIGSEMKRGEWQSIGRELIRLGLLQQSAEKFATVELSSDGLAALKSRRQITLTKPVTIAEKKARTRRGD